MRISDWSSDVCSSDLGPRADVVVGLATLGGAQFAIDEEQGINCHVQVLLGNRYLDRKSVVEGKSVSVRVDLGGRRSMKKTRHEPSKSHHRKRTDTGQRQGKDVAEHRHTGNMGN